MQHAVYQLVSDPQVHELTARARDAYTERSALLLTELAERGIGRPAGHRPDGLNVWVPLGTQARPVADALARRGWAVQPGHLFSAGAGTGQEIRVTTSTLTTQQAREFADDLAAVLPA
ncbi:hypothetical protein [Streptomyces humi]|uniref:hypothetical protein n=1 Tax=Streptomyces humi TaxID=1428620 RepID=UPI0011609008|nr:hypothetical protein [Streptomyces humi]